MYHAHISEEAFNTSQNSAFSGNIDFKIVNIHYTAVRVVFSIYLLFALTSLYINQRQNKTVPPGMSLEPLKTCIICVIDALGH